MIHRVLLKKNIHESKWLLAGCVAVMAGFCWLRVWFVSRIDMERFRALLELLPSDWRRFLPVDPEWLVTYPGRISLTYDEPLVMLCISIWAIARGSDVVSGELGRGTMELLLGQPITRLQIIASSALVTSIGGLIIAGSSWLGIHLGIHSFQAREEHSPTWQLPFHVPFLGSEVKRPLAEKQVRYVPMSKKVDSRVFWPALINLFALGFLLAGFSTLVSSCERYRWRTIGIVVGVFVVQLICKITSMSSPDLEWLKYLTILSAFEPEWIVRIHDLQPEHIWSFRVPSKIDSVSQFGPGALNFIQLLFGTGFYLASAFVFQRRDLPAP